MESIYTELALYGSKHECARTDHGFSPISEVCDGTVSLTILFTFVTLRREALVPRLTSRLTGTYVKSLKAPLPLENNDTLKCSSGSFAHTLRYVVNVENC